MLKPSIQIETFPMPPLTDSNLAFLRLSGFDYMPDNQDIFLSTYRLRASMGIGYGDDWRSHVTKMDYILEMQFPDDDPAVDAMKNAIRSYLNSTANPLRNI